MANTRQPCRTGKALGFYPLLSVVVPTFNRPHFLTRAISSALDSAPDGEVEVIVVPNGPGSSWKEIAEHFRHDHRVRWHPVSEAGVSAARNHGLERANGEWVRFLDDDDYLYPEACRRQCEVALSSNADISSGGLDVVHRDGSCSESRRQVPTSDFCVAMFRPGKIVQVGSHMYRRTAIGATRWNVQSSLGEDHEWMFELCASREMAWIRVDESVAAWVQHRHPRLSRGTDPGETTFRRLSEACLAAAYRLRAQGRLTGPRRQAVADNLWNMVQKGLWRDYMYWRRVALRAEEFSAGRRPPSAIHRLPVLRALPPLLVETALVPLRYCHAPARPLFERIAFKRI